MSSPPAPSGAAIASALGLPSELLELLNQMGMDVESLVQEPEHIYIEQLLEFTQGLPDPVQRPVDVRDPSAFGTFLGSASHGFFKKFLALANIQHITLFEPESHRFRAEHYVSPFHIMLK